MKRVRDAIIGVHEVEVDEEIGLKVRREGDVGGGVKLK